MFHECFHQTDGAGDVVLVVAERFDHGFTNGLVRREVDHAVNVVLATHLADGSCVRDVTNHEVDVGDCVAVATLQGVEHHDVATHLGEQACGMRADVPGPACDEGGHAISASSAVDSACRGRGPFPTV